MMYILDPTLDKEKTEALSAKIDEAISKQGASLESSEPWAGGRRRLAYPIKGHREGNYMLATLDAKPEAVGEIERRLRVMDGVLRFLTVRVDERQAKAERRRAQRESKEEARKGRRAERAEARTAEPSSAVEPVRETSSDDDSSDQAEEN